MNPRLVITAVLALALVAVASADAQQTAEELYQAALYEEEVRGDLERAIELYRGIVANHGDVRVVAAKSLLQLGNCYEKLGNIEARNAYERLLSDYADQTQVAAEARARLASLQGAFRAAAEAGITTRRLWSGLNANGHDVTPDGRYLVWRDAQGTGNLAVREVATGRSRFLTQDARHASPWAYPYGAKVSPDGKWIAHGYSVQGQGGSLRVMGQNGENLREVLREKGCWIGPYGWTSDGERVAARWSCWSEANPAGTFEIVLVSVTDGSVRTIHEVPSSAFGLRAALSPDDRYLAYDGPAERDDGHFDIWSLPLDGGEPIPLIRHPAKDRLLGWVPGTDQLLFLSDRDGTWDLWATTVRAGAMAGAPRKLLRDLGEINAVGFSESGSLFYSVFTRWFSTSIAPFDLSTGKADLEAATPLLGSNRNPQWSPDGRYLAFATESELTQGKLGRLNVRDLATGEQREVATRLGVRYVQDWSPDGSSILVVGNDDTQEDPRYRDGIYAVDVGSEQITPLVSLPEDLPLQSLSAEWSTDDRTIIYSVLEPQEGDARPRGRVLRRDVVSGEERELYRESLLIPDPLELAPDGRQLVLAIEDSLDAAGGGDGLAVLDLETGARRWIYSSGDSVSYLNRTSVQWTPDGEYILYSVPIKGDEWRTHVWRVAADGGEREYLWTVGEDKWGSWFELSPDGRRIAVTTYTQETEIWVMENLKEVLEREP